MALPPLSPPVPSTLLITTRFTTAHPDLTLPIPSPTTTTSLYLKHLIRTSLPASSPLKESRLRLIYRGKILPGTAFLSTILKLPPPPPRNDGKGKGKEKAEDTEDATRVYINCSIGDTLTTEELETEASTALASLTPTPKPSSPQNHEASNNKINSSEENTPTTTPAPLGFDRLLSTGFTPPEIQQLRLQFLAIQSNIHTPETMPSPSTLRRMEDAWIDNNGGDGPGGGGGGFEDMDNLPGALDDLLWGNVIGFLWPLGAVLAVREEGVWSRRRGIAVVGGAVISVMFGLMRVLS